MAKKTATDPEAAPKKKAPRKRAAKKDAASAEGEAVKEPTGANRRRHPRVMLGMLVQVQVDSIESFKADHCANISQSGMFLRTDDLRPIGTSFFFQFKLKDGGPLIEGQAKVVRVVEKGGAEPKGLGVEFESLLEPSKSIVEALVEERQRSTPPA